MSDIEVGPQPVQHIVVNPAGAAINVLHQEQSIVVNSSDNAVSVNSLTQHIIVDPATSSVSIVNAGPMGPRGLTGPPDAESVLTIDGQIMTRVLGGLAPISRVDLAADPAFTDYWAAHIAAADPHPGYMTTAEDAAIMVAHVAAADPHPGYLTAAEGDALFLTPAEGNAAYVNTTGDTMTGPLTLQYSGNSLVLKDASAYIAWFNGATRLGYLQGNAGGLLLNSETGRLGLNGADGLQLSPAKINGYTMSESTLGFRVVCTTSSGYIFGNYINMTADIVGGWPAYVAGQNGDNYMRWYNRSGGLSATQFRGTNNAIYYTDAALRADPGAGWATCSLHPGGIAITIGAPGGAGNSLYIRDYTGNAASANIHAANFTADSSRRWKRNINPYPLLAVGAAVPKVADVISRLQPVTFEFSVPDIEVPSERRGKAFQRLNRFRESKGLDPYELPIHDCDIHECNGTSENPCCRVINRERQLHGFIAEDVFEVLPEAVWLDSDRLPAGLDLGQIVSISIAAIKELITRVDKLEGATT